VAILLAATLWGGSEAVSVGAPAGDVTQGRPIALAAITCDPQPDAKRLAKRLMADQYSFPAHPTVTLPHDLRWNEDPLHDRNWVLQLHSLWFIRALTTQFENSGKQAFLERAIELARSWVSHNPRSNPAHPSAWNDHSTSMRGVVLSCLVPYIGHPAWLDKQLSRHGTLLADPNFYRGGGNHKLDQHISLLQIACSLNDKAWRTKAVETINDLARQLIDGQGAPNEQATAYNYYVYERFVYARRQLKACGQPIGDGFAKVDLMPAFLAQSTQPDGRYVMIGDTFDQQAIAIPGTEAEFAATRGASGAKPPMVATYDQGYAFVRTGWGETQPIADETLLTLRFGPGFLQHAHDDGGSLTLYGYGSRLLLDPGYNDYDFTSWRWYFKSREAHNSVVVDGLKSDIGRPTTLLKSRKNSSVYEASMSMAGYPGISNRRRVAFSRALGFSVVEDRLSSTKSRTYRQLWHLREASDPKVSGNRTWTRRERGNVLIQQLIDTGKTSLVSGRTKPTQGWVSYRFGAHGSAPVVQQTYTGKAVRYLTLLVPFASGTPDVQVSDLQVSARSFSFIVTIGGRAQRVTGTAKKIQISSL
jgi:hypothetical protein